MIEIVQSENPVLRKIAKDVAVSLITKPKIKKIIADMIFALDSQNDGVAIAAPQIGVSLRIFVVSGRIFDEDFIRGKGSTEADLYQKARQPDLVFINPVLKKISKDRKLMAEGCLSVRPIYGKVRRATRATVEAYDQNGNKFSKEGSGLLAHIFQHETDHLDGILFTDKAKEMYESFDEINSIKDKNVS
ncbi:TPA: peptide deformylase [Candidatus Nomurabacteria bacterium]|uniref:Peptide deformylase n=1 Tax=Candidatus Nomurabacteria bacterium GW2011_GWE1_35_16 TaxID=1618761 RepID=A0A0G0DVA6_9BACT|nr:MAG: Peptide deformylase [Candidatus Nomurabacteria bacterium GW2011_GWF1_34_20]KKP63753.1 MAG: Peptide deformylase [Candidatus Nomurabacteria bacterium GW2011_GWE2_34_25]KKP66965.1 MAG: Peptide deformylase [Candidatus Nomurabacteria bacterium GW2011_GWE1_35_16]HAE36787.1 peptide deformylase [Candidatus Nomurabacteria bacterium]HAX65510.1 peptide deformylase [Candidatus Nomurabacteria bacterium]